MVGFLKKVELVGVLSHPENDSWSPDDYPVVGAMGCFAEESSSNIHKRYFVDREPYVVGKEENRHELDWDQIKELIMMETSGRGHGAVTDQANFTFSIDNLSRASTLFLCGPEYASHLQQSLRRATAERGFVPVEDSKGNYLMALQFALYGRMAEAGVPIEDARIILPLNTKTTIQTSWDARELTHLRSMADRMNISSEVKDTVSQMYDAAYRAAPKTMAEREKNLEVLAWFPSSQLFARSNLIMERVADAGKGMEFLGYSIGNRMTGEEIERAVRDRDEALLANLKHYHFSFNIPMSLMSFHQATRQRTWNQSVEPLGHAVDRGVYVTPQSIVDKGFGEFYQRLMEESLKYVNSYRGNPEIQGIVPHGLEVYDAIHVNGVNAIHSIGKRTCKTAQWEIRAVANYIAREIREVMPEIGKFSKPQGIIYGTCPERENCGACGR
jgi:thymidylate synthase (FAD)